MKKALLIDDQDFVIKCIKRGLEGLNVVFAECHCVDEAVRAVIKEMPEILLLDNSLCGGDEGLQVVDRLKEMGVEIEIYSTTTSTDEELIQKYTERGVEKVGKTDFDQIKLIITGS